MLREGTSLVAYIIELFLGVQDFACLSIDVEGASLSNRSTTR